MHLYNDNGWSWDWEFLLFIAFSFARPRYCSVIYFFYYTKGVIEKKLQFSFKDRRSVASQYKETWQTELHLNYRIKFKSKFVCPGIR